MGCKRTVFRMCASSSAWCASFTGFGSATARETSARSAFTANLDRPSEGSAWWVAGE
jgi:hypothetical protein